MSILFEDIYKMQYDLFIRMFIPPVFEQNMIY